MVVAADGTAYVGTFGFDARAGAPFEGGPLLRVTAAGDVFVATEPLYFPNGMTISDEGELIVVETFGNRVSAFDVAPDGTLGERRDWATTAEIPDTSDLAGIFPQLVVAMDGISSQDAEGCIWVADYIHPRIVRIKMGVGIVDEVETATGLNSYATALGGADGRTLLLFNTAADTDPELRRNEPAGQVEIVRVDVPARHF